MPADTPMVLPCPFCDGLRGPPVASSWLMGRAAEMGTATDVWGHQVRCICGAGGPDRNSEAEAVAAWNQRALSASPVGEGLGALQPQAASVPTEQAGGPVVGWQPIETAPRDGTWIIASVGRHGVVPVRWGVSWHDQHWANGCVVYEPTHWQPLPPAPSTTSTAEQVGTEPPPLLSIPGNAGSDGQAAKVPASTGGPK